MDLEDGDIARAQRMAHGLLDNAFKTEAIDFAGLEMPKIERENVLFLMCHNLANYFRTYPYYLNN